MLNHGAQLGFVPRAAQLVEDHPRNADRRVKRLVTQNQRRNSACHAARIQHQHHRQAQHFCQRSIAVAAVQRQAIVKPFIAFYDVNIGAVAVLYKGVGDAFLRLQVRIEIEAGVPTGLRQPHGVDVVRPFFIGLHMQTACRKRGTQTDSNRGLAGRLMCGRDQQAIHGQNI